MDRIFKKEEQIVCQQINIYMQSQHFRVTVEVGLLVSQSFAMEGQ